MTQIAQKIDNENRELIKRNAELKIEFKSQENDRELLLKQIIFQKKENQKLKEELDRVKKVAEDLEKKMQEEEKTAQQLESRDYLPGKGTSSVHLPGIQQRSKPGSSYVKRGGQRSMNRISATSSRRSLRGVPLSAQSGAFQVPDMKTRAYSGNVIVVNTLFMQRWERIRVFCRIRR